MVNRKRRNEDDAEMATEESQDGKKRKKETAASKFITPYPLETPSVLVNNWLRNDNSLESREKLAEKFWEIYRRFRDPDSDLYVWMDNEIAAQNTKGLSVPELKKMRVTVWDTHYYWARNIDEPFRRCVELYSRPITNEEDQHRVKKLSDQFEELKTHFGENFRLVRILYNLDKYKAAIVEAGGDKSNKFDKAWTSYRKEAAKFSYKKMMDSLQDEKSNREEKKRIKEHLEYYSTMCNEVGIVRRTRTRTRRNPDFTYNPIIPFPLPSETAFTFKNSKLKVKDNPTLEDYKSFADEFMGVYKIYQDRKCTLSDSILHKWKAKDVAAQTKKYPEISESQVRQRIDEKIGGWRRYVDSILLQCKEEVEEMGARDLTLPVQPVMDQFEELRHLFFELNPFNLGQTLDSLDSSFKKTTTAKDAKKKASERRNFRHVFEPCEYKLDALLKAQELTDSDKERILKFKQLYSEIKSIREKGKAVKDTKHHEEEQDHIDNQELEEDEESDQKESDDECGSGESDRFDESAHFNDALYGI